MEHMTCLKYWAILTAVCCSPNPLAQAPTAADARNRRVLPASVREPPLSPG
jgi:hypothetical protein